MPHTARDPRGLRVWLSTGAHHLNGDRLPPPACRAGRSRGYRDEYRSSRLGGVFVVVTADPVGPTPRFRDPFPAPGPRLPRPGPPPPPLPPRPRLPPSRVVRRGRPH